MTFTQSSAVRGQGTTLKNASNYAIAEITKIGAFGVTRDDIDVTNHDTSNNCDDWIAGQCHGGELAITANLIRTDTSGQVRVMQTALLAGTKEVYTITLPSCSTWAATMHCKSYKVNDDLKNQVTVDLVFKVSGVPTWTP